MLIVPAPYWPFGMSPRNVRYSIGWSSVRTARWFGLLSIGMPLGTAHDQSTPSCSRRRSQCRRRAWCSCTTKRGSLVRRPAGFWRRWLRAPAPGSRRSCASSRTRAAGRRAAAAWRLRRGGFEHERGGEQTLLRVPRRDELHARGDRDRRMPTGRATAGTPALFACTVHAVSRALRKSSRCGTGSVMRRQREEIELGEQRGELGAPLVDVARARRCSRRASSRCTARSGRRSRGRAGRDGAAAA